MKVSKVAVLPALLLAGCLAKQSGNQITYDPCQPLVVSPAAGTSPQQLQALQSAIAMWNGYGLAQLTLQDSAGATILPLQFKDGPDPFHGVYEPDKGDVIVNSKLTDPGELAVVLAHEIGHAMGLQHISPDQRVSVMNPDNLSETVTAQDGAELAALWNQCASSSGQAH